MGRSKKMNLECSTYWHNWFRIRLWILAAIAALGIFINSLGLDCFRIPISCDGLGNAIGAVGIISSAVALVNQFRQEYAKGIQLGSAMDSTYPHYMQFLIQQGLFVAMGIYAGKAGHQIVCILCAIGVLVCLAHTLHILWRLSPGVNRRDRFIWSYIDDIREKAGQDDRACCHYVQLAAKDIARRMKEIDWIIQTDPQEGNRATSEASDLSAAIISDIKSLCRFIDPEQKNGLFQTEDLSLLRTYSSFFALDGKDLDVESILYREPAVEEKVTKFRKKAFLCWELWRSALSEADTELGKAKIAYAFFQAVEERPAVPMLGWGLMVYLYHWNFTEGETYKCSVGAELNTSTERCASFLKQFEILCQRETWVDGKRENDIGHWQKAMDRICWDMTLFAIHLAILNEMLSGHRINDEPLKNAAIRLLNKNHKLDTSPLYQENAFYKYLCFAFLGHSFVQEIYCPEMMDCISDALKMGQNYLR